GDWPLELDGLHQAPAADLADLGKSQPTNAFLETLARPGGAGMQRLVRQHPQRDGSGDANQRIAGEGAAMAPLGNALTDRLGSNGHADGQAIGDRLREAEDVGHDVLAGEGERGTGAKPGLDLVTYK